MPTNNPFFNAEMFLEVYSKVLQGEEISPRGAKCREVTDAMFPLSLEQSPLTSFKARHLNLKYAKEEMRWYIRGDKFDQSIEEHAKMWQKIRQPDGSYYSNYGQYIFGEMQFQYVVGELKKDPWSRRASMVLLKREHLFDSNTDVVCTYSLNFRIRNGMLHMSVNMRSNDVIFGMTNDVFCFHMLYRMVFALVQEQYRDIDPGLYMHKVDSLHVYERHYDMIQAIVNGGMEEYEHIIVPWPTASEVRGTIKHGLEERGPWSRWLLS